MQATLEDAARELIGFLRCRTQQQPGRITGPSPLERAFAMKATPFHR